MELESMASFEPLPVSVNQPEKGKGRIAQACCKVDEIVERKLVRCIQYVQPFQDRCPFGLFEH